MDENINDAASAIGETCFGFPLSIQEDLPNAFDPTGSGGKINCGQYMTTGHRPRGRVFISFFYPCQEK
jgi:hypothetical protein